MTPRFAVFGLAIAGATLLSNCAHHDPIRVIDEEAIRAGTGAIFDRAFYLKPRVNDGDTNRAARFAPLLIIEAAVTNAIADVPSPTAQPQIFYRAGRQVISGKQYEQLTYWWTYQTTKLRRYATTQGVRITLDSAGSPVIWETLADTSGARIVFVSQNLETDALRQFGAPLAGRRFAVERSSAEAPDTIVARVISDGAVPMGPMVYVRANSRDIMTVTCRCMDSQAKELAGQLEYTLSEAAPAAGRVGKTLPPALRMPDGF